MNRYERITRRMAVAALIAAIYTALTYISAGLGIAYGGIQFRLSEVLNILPLFTPAAVPGLAIGCFFGNITSPFGILDVVLGTLATFLSAISVQMLGKAIRKGRPFVAVLPPTLFNAVIVGLEIAAFVPDTSYATAFLISAAQVGLGELGVCTLLGIPFYYISKKLKLHKLL